MPPRRGVTAITLGADVGHVQALQSDPAPAFRARSKRSGVVRQRSRGKLTAARASTAVDDWDISRGCKPPGIPRL